MSFSTDGGADPTEEIVPGDRSPANLPPTIPPNGDTLRSRLLAVALSTLPQIDRLVLATVTTVPEWHPEHDTFVPFPVHAWLIRHPDGAILVDTGVGVGNKAINEWYHPRTTSLLDALAGIGVASSDISARDHVSSAF